MELLLSLCHAQCLLLVQIQVLPVQCSSNTPSTPDFSSLDRSIQRIVFLISVGMVAIMDKCDLGRASKLPIDKPNPPCQYPQVPSLLLCFFSLHLLFSSFTPEKSPQSGSKPAVPENFALSSQALLFLHSCHRGNSSHLGKNERLRLTLLTHEMF